MHDDKRGDTRSSVPIGTIIYFSAIAVISLLLVLIVVNIILIRQQMQTEEEAYTIQEEVCFAQEEANNELLKELEAAVKEEANEPVSETDTKQPSNDAIDETTTTIPLETNTPNTQKKTNKTKTVLERKNEDIVGWIQIKGTNINYPVLQSTDDSFYLSHNYKKEKSSAGSILMYSECSFENDNVTLYGHHMNNKKHPIMFSELVNYYDKEYAIKHPTILFGTDYDNMKEYKVLCALHINKETTNLSYARTTFPSKVIFEAYMQQLISLAIMKTNIKYSYGDQLLTLSTCDRHDVVSGEHKGENYGANGRCIIVAVKAGEPKIDENHVETQPSATPTPTKAPVKTSTSQ